MAVVYLGLGSNLGNRKKNIQSALKCLNQNGVAVKKISTIIETKPVGGPATQGKFLNAALEVQTTLTPEALRATLKTIEDKLGRVRTVKNGPRTIDIDILLYGARAIKTKNLTIPHPRMLKRSFVIKPLREIAPQVVSKLLAKSKSEKKISQITRGGRACKS